MRKRKKTVSSKGAMGKTRTLPFALPETTLDESEGKQCGVKRIFLLDSSSLLMEAVTKGSGFDK